MKTLQTLPGAAPHFIKSIANAYGASYDDDSEGYLIPCNTENLPNLVFTFGEVKIVMKPEDLFTDIGVCINLSTECHQPIISFFVANLHLDFRFRIYVTLDLAIQLIQDSHWAIHFSECLHSFWIGTTIALALPI